jgi:hypothetical protein
LCLGFLILLAAITRGTPSDVKRAKRLVFDAGTRRHGAVCRHFVASLHSRLTASAMMMHVVRHCEQNANHGSSFFLL